VANELLLRARLFWRSGKPIRELIEMKDILTRWPVVQQILTRGDGMHADAASDRTRNLAPKHHGAQVVRSVCPYYAVGRSQLVYHKDGKLISIEGDPESHISRGRLCPKGSDSHELLTHADRETRMNIAVHTRREELDLEVTSGELRLLLRIEEKFQHFAENKIMKRIYC
jgi:hypothetical protein